MLPFCRADAKGGEVEGGSHDHLWLTMTFSHLLQKKGLYIREEHFLSSGDEQAAMFKVTLVNILSVTKIRNRGENRGPNTDFMTFRESPSDAEFTRLSLCLLILLTEVNKSHAKSKLNGSLWKSRRFCLPNTRN